MHSTFLFAAGGGSATFPQISYRVYIYTRNVCTYARAKTLHRAATTRLSFCAARITLLRHDAPAPVFPRAPALEVYVYRYTRGRDLRNRKTRLLYIYVCALHSCCGRRAPRCSLFCAPSASSMSVVSRRCGRFAWRKGNFLF